MATTKQDMINQMQAFPPGALVKLEIPGIEVLVDVTGVDFDGTQIVLSYDQDEQ